MTAPDAPTLLRWTEVVATRLLTIPGGIVDARRAALARATAEAPPRPAGGGRQSGSHSDPTGGAGTTASAIARLATWDGLIRTAWVDMRGIVEDLDGRLGPDIAPEAFGARTLMLGQIATAGIGLEVGPPQLPALRLVHDGLAKVEAGVAAELRPAELDPPTQPKLRLCQGCAKVRHPRTGRPLEVAVDAGRYQHWCRNHGDWRRDHTKAPPAELVLAWYDCDNFRVRRILAQIGRLGRGA